MQTFIVLSALVAVAVAAPGYLAAGYAPYGYHAPAPLGHDGRVIDTPAVAHAKAAHLAAHANEAARNAYGSYAYAPAIPYAAVPYPSYPVHGYSIGAPLAADGRVIDTPEVAHAKAAHLAAHAQEAAKTAGHGAYGALAYAHSPIYAYGYGAGAPIGHDGRVVDTPEVAHAKAAHYAAHAAASH